MSAFWGKPYLSDFRHSVRIGPLHLFRQVPHLQIFLRAACRRQHDWPQNPVLLNQESHGPMMAVL
jgi:hypothetical protein